MTKPGSCRSWCVRGGDAYITVTRMLAVAVGLYTTIIGGPAVSAAAPESTGAARLPIERITGLPLPLLEGERLARLKDGCHVILDSSALPTADAGRAQQQWLGACRFGLIDGPGFFRFEGAPPMPFTARMGRGVRETEGPEIFPPIGGRPTQWLFQFFSTPDEARAWANSRPGPRLPESLRGDLSWSTNIVLVSRTAGSDGPAETLDISIEHNPCIKAGPRESIEQSFVSILRMSPANAKSLAPFCTAALARLRRERPDLLSEWEWSPYKALPWGYYHLVRVRRAKGPTGGSGTSEETFVCPQPGNGASCQAIWGPIVAPYLAIRDAERKRQAEIERKREAMIQALEAALAEKRRNLSAKPDSRRTK